MHAANILLARFNGSAGRRFLFWSAIIFPAGAVAAAFFVGDWPARRFLVFYIAPLFLAGPLWLRIRLSERVVRGDLLSGVDAAVFSLAVVRFLTGDLLPFSGHMLFLTYSFLVTASTAYRLLAFALLVLTTWFKLFLWHDPSTWSVGMILGIIAAGVALKAGSRLADQPSL